MNDVRLSLDEIPTHLKLQEKNFTLIGLISFHPLSKSATVMGHYTAYCWCSLLERWQLFDDLQQSPKFVRKSTSVKAQYLFYSI